MLCRSGLRNMTARSILPQSKTLGVSIIPELALTVSRSIPLMPGTPRTLYIYADYGVEKQMIESKLDSFKGYKVIGKHDIALNQLAPAWRPHIRMTKELVEESRRWATAAPGVLGGMYREPRQLFCRSCWR